MSEARPERPLAAALDLGSSFVKAGLLDHDGRLTGVRSRTAPELRGQGPIREGDAEDYARTASALLAETVGGLAPDLPLGIASQRSTFVLWDRGSRRPLRPMVSWQDRRAADWCARHAELGDEVRRRTGLVLSGHYAGPKLAAIQEQDPAWTGLLRNGHTLFGTLETWLVWCWSGGRIHETDPSMAARTSLLDLESGEWSDDLLKRFGVPREILPTIRPTDGWSVRLEDGPCLRASVADQAAGALALLPDGGEAAMVNLGTGGFVLRPVEDGAARRDGYLTGWIHGDARGRRRYTLEGAINGAGAAVDRFGPGPTELPMKDPDPQAFCLPDAAGLGSPYWRADVGLSFSPAATALPLDERRRIVLEGLLFRVREVLDDLGPPAVLLAGGLAREPFVARGIAALLDRPVGLLVAHEAVLTGAARLAAGLASYAAPRTRTIEPAAAGRYLRRKYPRWKSWLHTLLS